MNRLRISQPLLLHLAEQLPADGRRVLMCRLGLNRLARGREWLAQPPFRPYLLAGEAMPRLQVAGATDVALLPSALQRLQALGPDQAESVLLALGTGAAAGHAVGLCRTAEGWAPLDGLDLVGPELPSIALSPEARLHRLLAQMPEPTEEADPAANTSEDALTSESLWSRTIGALGETAWRRLTQLQVLVVAPDVPGD